MFFAQWWVLDLISESLAGSGRWRGRRPGGVGYGNATAKATGAAAAAVRGGARRPRRGTTSVWGAGAHGAPGSGARGVYNV